MRLAVNALIAAMVLALLASVLWHNQRERRLLSKYQATHEALALLHEKAIYHGTLSREAVSPTGFPLVVSPVWFRAEGLPLNAMVPGRQPWMDVAPPGDTKDHPPDPVIQTDHQAGFWYNPNRGIFRARALPSYTDADTLAIYNHLNGTSLESLPTEHREARRPQPHPMLTQLDLEYWGVEQDDPAVAADAQERAGRFGQPGADDAAADKRSTTPRELPTRVISSDPDDDPHADRRVQAGSRASSDAGNTARNNADSSAANAGGNDSGNSSEKEAGSERRGRFSAVPVD